MTANLQIKNDRYYVVINYKQDGKYKQKWVATGLPIKNNKRKAEAMIPEIVTKFEAGLVGSTSDTLFTDYAMVWMRKKYEQLSPATRYTYNATLKKHIIAYFEPLNLKLKDIRPKHIQEYLDYEAMHGNTRGNTKASLSLMCKIKYYLNAILKDATAQELIARNPAQGIRPSFQARDSAQHCFLTAERANELLELLAGDALYPIVYLTLLYGLRKSEVLGLRWQAIDFKNDTLSLNHTVVVVTKIVEKDEMKNRSSNHVYKLLPNAKKVLMEQYEIYLNKKKSPIFNDKGYVFCEDDGNAIHPQKVTRVFARALDRLGFPKMRFHDLRHSTASILYENGWNIKDIQTWMRHSSIAVTGDIYTHVSDARESQIGSNMNDVLQPAEEVDNDEGS